ncbi:putative zinc-binding metallopeptidase [Prevotella sp. oral taxon 299]|uniref:zinc-binding metallopeptidase n=1 Tax=Prevotella sp. oral taxon 299 TaxID=652716 RepID=UPI000313F4E8|nr:putative zinc-binding metallopeptidase [Prevotella sp. oral taxon 299]EFC70444.2 hypothetical protein HMPREF0669_01424 [Prevotella sp. oral taxon 299 str. F0039]
MKYRYLLIAVLFTLAGSFVSCSKDNLDSTSIFPETQPKLDKFETWMENNYTLPYNVDMQYKLNDIETEGKHNLVPADSAKSAKLAIITKYMWFDAYNEVAGQNFVKLNSPRVVMLVGSPAFNSDGTETLATAEGGYKVTLYRVNELTKATIYNYNWLNFYFFHTMHHEFTHILNQKKPYDESFDKITPTTYVSGEWYQLGEEECLKEGYISNYARSEPREDFAELLSFYVTDSPQKWNDRLQRAGTKGASLINQKIALIKSYMKNSWNIDIDDLRDVVLRRGKDLRKIDLEHLN